MEPVTMAAIQVAKSEAGKKAIKAGCLLAAGTIVLPFFLFLALLGALVSWAVNNDASASGCVTQGDLKGANMAVIVLQGAGVTDEQKIVTMVAIAGSESGWDPKAINGSSGAAGLWQVLPAAHPQYFPPNKPDGWILDPANNAEAAVAIAGGPGIATITPWQTDIAVKAWVAAGGAKAPPSPWSLADTVDDSKSDFSQARNAFASVGSQGGSGGVSGSGGPSLKGPSEMTAAQIVTWWGKQSYGSPQSNPNVSIQTLADYYINEGNDEGITGDIAFAQAVLETGGFQSFDSRVKNNFAGIGAYDSNPGNAGTWATPQLGVRAQIQLLRKVVDGNGANLAHPDVSPNWGGKQTDTWDGLTQNWATDPTYTTKIMQIYNSMRASAGLPPVGNGCGGGGIDGCINPIVPAQDWGPARTDMGIDWLPLKSTVPVLAMCNGIVTYSRMNSGWPFSQCVPNDRAGAYIQYKVTDGAQAGYYIYVAEHLSNIPSVGDKITAGQQIALAHQGACWTEWGWAKAACSGCYGGPCVTYNGDPDGTPEPGGKAMTRFMKELGAKPLSDWGAGADNCK